MKKRLCPAALSLALALAASPLTVFPLAVSAEPSAHQGCFGRLSTTPPCTAPAGRGTFLAPFRKPNQPYSIGTRTETRASLANSASVVSQSFRRVTETMGEWSGIVSGNGVVHLALQITENGAVKSTRYIGNVTLSKDSTSFHFRSSLPTSGNWNWKIVAFSQAA